VLLERNGFLGGLATAAQVGTICGLYLRDTANAKATPVSGGFALEFASRLQRAADTAPLRLESGLWVLPYPIPAFARVADAVVTDSGNVTVALHATVADARAEGSRVVEVRALAWNEPLVVRPGAVVDCTGEATAAALAGVDVENGIADQAPALVFTLENVDPSLAERGLLEVRLELRRAVQAGSLPALCERLSLVPRKNGDGRLVCKLNLVPAAAGHPFWRQVTAWEREARALVDQLQRFLIQNIPACGNARLASVAPQLGIRSGRRIRGRASLPDEAVLSAQKSALGIARGCWPMERWGDSPRPEMAFFDERDYYEIPMDCLRLRGLDNVFAAGRCFSAAARAMTSARVIGSALATGWAAGTAAAFQTQGRTVEEAVSEIRKGLDRQDQD
jgi:hypothetical protein